MRTAIILLAEWDFTRVLAKLRLASSGKASSLGSVHAVMPCGPRAARGFGRARRPGKAKEGQGREILGGVIGIDPTQSLQSPVRLVGRGPSCLSGSIKCNSAVPYSALILFR